MLCIAAFIVLCVIGLFVAFLSLFQHNIGQRYWRVFKKSWGCIGKKIRLQKCETNFREDIKYTVLKKIVLQRPQLVKPISAFIEFLAVIVVFITVWSIAETIKALLALWIFGTCNVTQPASCALSSATCSIDGAAEAANPVEATGRWFTEWGEIFGTIPDRLHAWPAENYLVEPYAVFGKHKADKPFAIDIFDPGCSACLQSYRNQKSDGFLNRYNVVLMPYPIKLPNGEYKFHNSDLITRYLHAATITETSAAPKLIDKLFTESNKEGINYQSLFSNELSPAAAERLLQSWLRDFGLPKTKISAIASMAQSEQINTVMQKIDDIVNQQIHAKGIPTLIYDQKLHTGLYE